MSDSPNPTGPNLTYGIDSGIRFACMLDGTGGARVFSAADLKAWRPGQGKLWVHLERDSEHCRNWLHGVSGLDTTIIAALLAEDSRPRVETLDDALLVVLRGVNHNEREDPEDLVPVHLWIDQDRVISLREQGHFLLSLREIRESLAAGRGPRDIGDLFARIADKIVKHLEPLVDEIEEDVDELDKRIADSPSEDSRRALSDIRRHSAKLRRYIAPQRETMFRLQSEEATWLGKHERIQLREITDRMVRLIESLDVVRDRATFLHEDLTALIAEQISKNSYRLTAVAAVLLPPSLVAGIFGMNLGGLPGSSKPYAFAVACVVMAVLLPLEYWLLKKFKWL